MNYKDMFIKSYHETLKIGLDPGSKVLPFKATISKKKVDQILTFCAMHLRLMGFTRSSELAGKCIPVHIELQFLLREKFSVKSNITIGDKFWNDYVYCEMSYKSIEQELQKPNINNPIKAHVWLTLSDGSILDCTGEAHMDVIWKRGDFPAENCIAYVPSDKVMSNGYYRPYLVGGDFLIKTGAIRIQQPRY